jgi:hypothetical protein
MPELVDLDTFSDHRGSLTVIEKILPFEIRRVFYIYGVDGSTRGRHRHHRTVQAAICLNGSCVISNDNGRKQESFLLDSPARCLILHPEDYHVMHSFSHGAILLVLASEEYDPTDYIHEPYR